MRDKQPVTPSEKHTKKGGGSSESPPSSSPMQAEWEDLETDTPEDEEDAE